jgi:hypothetical protein
MLIQNLKIMKEFFISIRPCSNGNHVVHKHDCPLMPEPGKRIFLGAFQSAADAVKEGIRYFRRTDNCPFCLKEHKEMKRKVLTAGKVKPDLISSSHLKVTWESQMFCSLS